MQNEPAFPTPHQIIDANHEHFKFGSHGMSLRDYFAAKAMQTLVHYWCEGDTVYATECSVASYKFADAMLEARKAGAK